MPWAARPNALPCVGPSPLRLQAFGRIMAPPLLTKLDDPKEPGLQVLGGWPGVC